MKAEELLKPRYKVIADYPDSNCEIGHIISGRKAELWSDFYDKYPHIFKKLEWWEEREVEDMPSKITHKESIHKEVVNIDGWIFIDGEIMGFQSDNIGVSVLDGWLPVD